MPRNSRSNDETPVPSTALALPDDVRADLLRAQSSALEGANLALPRVKIMGAGVGLYEFEGEEETPRTFDGIILSYHAQNVLWDKPYGTERAEGDLGLPACQSPDAVTGYPREGFVHFGLGDEGAEATPDDTVACKGCEYNAWQSASLVGKRGKGKACTNQMAVYIMLPDRAMPVQLTLPPTSLTAFNEYLMALINRSVPVQAVLTRFAQVKKSRDELNWAQATFSEARPLTVEEFNNGRERKEAFREAMSPQRIVVTEGDAPGF